MPMSPELVAALNAENPTDDFHGKLLEKCKRLVKLSRDRMSWYYDKWDKYDMTFRGERVSDIKDIKARERKEPEKMVVPLTFSQVMTFSAFQQQLFTQRPVFFEMDGAGSESAQSAKVAEAVLEHNLTYNNWKGDKLPQFLLNVGRYGLGVLKDAWTEKTQTVEEMVAQPVMQAPGLPPVNPPMVMQPVEKVTYQGNEILNISPYRFFPDPRVPLTKFQRGEFCASEEEYGKHELDKMEANGFVAGVKWIPKFTVENLYNGARRVSFSDALENQTGVPDQLEPHYYVITEVQIELIPSEWIVNGVPLGASKTAEKWVIWYANDARIIRVVPMGYLHNEFTYSVAQYNNDHIRYINFGIAEIIEQLQDVENWFINSHITSVRKVVNNYLVVDPKGVEMQDLKDRNPVIRLKPSAHGSGVDRWIKQLSVNDVTASHVQDAMTMEKFAQNTTGINENILGQFSPGRRSAREAGNVAQSAAARLILNGVAIWETAFAPLARRMISNCRDGMTVPQLVRVLGVSNFQNQAQGVAHFLAADTPMLNPPVGPNPPMSTQPLGGWQKVNKENLMGNYDLLIFDGTLPSQRGAIAQRLQELLSVITTNPQLAVMFQYDPSLLLTEILELSGIRNPDRFRLTQQAFGSYLQLAQIARNAAPATKTDGGNGAAGGGGA